MIKNVTKVLLLLITISAITIGVAISGCTTSTYTHTSIINGSSYTFTTHKQDTLTIPTDASYPPFESINSTTNQIEGFDIDIMDQICHDLNVTPQYSNMVFDSIITDIQTGKDDCSISAFTITADREKTIDFSNQYYENKGQAIMTKVNSTIQGPSDLVGHNVGAEKGTVGYYDVLNISGYNPSDLHGYETMPDSFLALQNGDVDAVVGDYAVMEPFVNQNAGEFTFAPNFMSETEYFGIVVNKNNPELTAAINAALANIKADGRYQQIYNKWFGQ